MSRVLLLKEMIMDVIFLFLLFQILSLSNADGIFDNCKLKIQLTPETNKTIGCEENGIITVSLKLNKTITFQQLTNAQEDNSKERIIEIHMSNSELESFVIEDSAIGFLQKLDFSNNSIRNLHKNAFGLIPNVEHIDLSKNRLTENDILAFHDLKSLVNLDLSHNNFKSINSNSFETLSKLTVLDLSHNSVYVVSTTFLDHHQNLRILYLQNNEIGNINLQIPSITQIDLSFNEIRTVNLPDLNRLDLSNNKIRATISFNDVQIDISNNELTDFKALSEVTRSISATHNQIKIITTSFFPKSKYLEYLDLSNNVITEIEDNALNSLRELTMFNLSHNKIVDFKFRVFDTLSSLEMLDISYNNFIYLYDIPFAGSFSFDILGKLNQIILNDNQWSCKFLNQLSKATFSVVGAHSTCKSDVNDFVIDFDKTVPIESDLPRPTTVDEDEILKILQKHLLNMTVFEYFKNNTEFFSDLKSTKGLNNEDIINIVNKYLETKIMNGTIAEYIKALPALKELKNQIPLGGPLEPQGNSNTTEHATNDLLINKLFVYVLLVNTVTTALLLLVIIIAICVICKRRRYKVNKYEDGY